VSNNLFGLSVLLHPDSSPFMAEKRKSGRDFRPGFSVFSARQLDKFGMQVTQVLAAHSAYRKS
jgi:hypothetical protein